MPNNFWRFTPLADVLVDTTVALLLNQGNGTFGAPSEMPLGPPDTTPAFLPEESFVVAEDLDGDGDTDLAVTDGSQNSLYVLRNAGTGAFSVSTPYSVASPPRALVAADLDGDGSRDLALTLERVSGDHANAGVLLIVALSDPSLDDRSRGQRIQRERQAPTHRASNQDALSSQGSRRTLPRPFGRCTCLRLSQVRLRATYGSHLPRARSCPR